MGMFDQAARYACRAQPAVVAARLLRGLRERLAFVRLHESKTNPLPGQRERIADSVLALDNLDAPASPGLMILEFQSGEDEDKLHSTLVSVAHLRADVRHGADGKGRYAVFAGLVYLCGRAAETSIQMTLTDAEGRTTAGTAHRALVWNVADDDATEALAEVEADFEPRWGLLFWVPLMRGAASAENLAKWVELAQRVASKRARGNLGSIAVVFSELAGTLGEWQAALKEMEMKESQVVMEWMADARREERVATRRLDVLRAARLRFKGELTEEDEQMISTQESADVLGAWLDAAVAQPTYADFRAVLRR
jgi:hypothetical protein